MKLPNGDQTVVSDEKLLRYLLNPAHPQGQHHSLLFDRLLGINLSNAYVLRHALHGAAKNEQAILGKSSPCGQKYEIRFQMTGPRRTHTILGVWIIPQGETIPHLVTDYVE